MSALAPIYTRENCSFAFVLNWGLTVFWRSPVHNAPWTESVAETVEADSIRLLGHRFAKLGVSQFSLSTQPEVAPLTIVQRVKGRLQYCVRKSMPKALKRNFALRSFGQITRQAAERYVMSQLGHHAMADSRVQQRLESLQIFQPDLDLSQARSTSHGRYWYNLHLVLVHRERWTEIRHDVLQRVRDMMLKVSTAKGYLLSRGGILADHFHLTLGCPFEVAPVDIALAFLNNLAYVHGMRPVYQFGAYLETIGEYDQRAVVSETSLHGDKPCGGGGET